MDYAHLGILIFGLIFAGWGAFILLIDAFYVWWRDRYWKEEKEAHLSHEALIYNRYIEGIGSMFIGVMLIYIALFF